MQSIWMLTTRKWNSRKFLTFTLSGCENLTNKSLHIGQHISQQFLLRGCQSAGEFDVECDQKIAFSCWIAGQWKTVAKMIEYWGFFLHNCNNFNYPCILLTVFGLIISCFVLIRSLSPVIVGTSNITPQSAWKKHEIELWTCKGTQFIFIFFYFI